MISTACAAPQIAPILREEAFEPVTPVMPEEVTSVTGSIFLTMPLPLRLQAEFSGRRHHYGCPYRGYSGPTPKWVETTREGINSPLQALQGAFALQDNRFERASKVVPFDNLSIESKGAGTANQAASLSGAIAATVVQVLPNRSLVIKGQKRLTLSEGSETIQLLGLVDQRHIQPDNTVLSSRLANARISYEGSGDLSAMARVPWGTSIFNKVWPF